MTLEEFIDRIDGFVDKKASEQIPYLGYFLVTYNVLLITLGSLYISYL